MNEMTRSCNEPSRMPGEDAEQERQRDHQGEDPEGEDAGIGEARGQQPADRFILLERLAEIAARRRRRPSSGSARRKGTLQTLLLEPGLIVLIARARTTAKPPSSLTAICFLNLSLSKIAKRMSEMTPMMSTICSRRLARSLSMGGSAMASDGLWRDPRQPARSRRVITARRCRPAKQMPRAVLPFAGARSTPQLSQILLN